MGVSCTKKGGKSKVLDKKKIQGGERVWQEKKR